MNITEIIRNRNSCRTYSTASLTEAHKEIINRYIQEVQGLFGEKQCLKIIEKAGTNNKLKLDYGMIRGHHSYLLGKSPANAESRINYGYVTEKVILKATELGIATCWIGVFDQEYFSEMGLEKDYEIPGIVIFGYPEVKPSGIDKLLRLAVGASRRQDPEKLFFNYNSGKPLSVNKNQKYSDSLEMVRLAPSSGNTQPWRVYFNDQTNEFHFYKKIVNKNYEQKGLHDVDMGIALSHFELTCDFNRFSGEWVRLDEAKIQKMEAIQYIISWKEK